LRDLFGRRFGEDVRFHFNLTSNFAGAQNLQTIAQFLDDAELHEPVDIENIARQLLELLNVHDGEFLLENIGEAPLRETTMQRHLAAFETAHDAVTGDGAGALVTARCRLSFAGTHAAADSLLAMLLAFRWCE